MADSPHELDFQGLRRVLGFKLYIFAGILVVTVILTYVQLEPLVKFFGTDDQSEASNGVSGPQSPVPMLTRLWIIASLAATGILTFLGNHTILRHALSRGAPVGQDRNTEIIKRGLHCEHLNFVICGAVVALIGMALWDECGIFWINLGAGPVLVAIIMVFDWNVMLFWHSLGEETRLLVKAEFAAKDGKVGDAYGARVAEDESEYAKARWNFFRLDIPIYCGLLMTFGVGMVLLPKVIVPGEFVLDNPYVLGAIAKP